MRWPLLESPSSSSSSFSWKAAVHLLVKMTLVAAQEVRGIAVHFLKEETGLSDEEEEKPNQWDGLIMQVVQTELAHPLMK